MSRFNYLQCKNCGCGLTIRCGGSKVYFHSSSGGLKCHCGCNNPQIDREKLEALIKEADSKNE